MSKKDSRKPIQTESKPHAPKKGVIEIDGEIIEAMRNANFRVKLKNGVEIICVINGKMRMHNIKILVGDNVKVEMSPYDLTKGRICYKYKPNVKPIEPDENN